MSDSMDNKTVFTGNKYAENYRKGRATYPSSLIEAILKYVKEKLSEPLVLGVDVGCGPGESTWILQPFFQNVVGLDYCQSMVDYANKTNQFSNVTYKTSSAEHLPFEDSTVTLITAGRAIQYFDFEKFFAECQRVLIPGGVVAFYSSDHVKFIIDDEPEKALQLNELFRKLREEDTNGFWEGQIGIKQRRYVDIKVPFADVKEIRDESVFSEKNNYSLQDLLSLFLSVPAFLKFATVKGEHTWNSLLQNFINEFLKILDLPLDTDPANVKMKARHNYFVIMGRKS